MPAAFTRGPQAPSAASRGYNRANRWLGSLIQRVTLPEDEAPGDFLGKLVSSTPPWLISLIVHFSIMILMGLMVLEAHTQVNKPDETIEVDLGPELKEDQKWAENIGEQLKDPSQHFNSEGLEPSKDDVAAIPLSSSLPEVQSPLVGPPQLDPSPEGTMVGGTVAAPNIGIAFMGREQGQKKVLLQSYGGTQSTEDAVKAGLAWLVRQQRSRGSWSLRGPYKHGAGIENEEAATAMALLAFQGAGYTPAGLKSDPYTRVVTRGWNYLLSREEKDGHFFANLLPDQHQLYTQALCTIAICELYGMTRDEKYLEPAQRAVDYCVKYQSPEGGWRYRPGIDSDLSVTGWFGMAMQSARMAGIEVPSPVFERIAKFLDTVAQENGSRYAYQFNAGFTKPLTAEGLLTRQYLGWPHDDKRLRGGVDYLLANLPNWNDRNVYYWYYGTQVCHHMEGSDWQKWNEVMRQLLPEHQEKRGPERGSWDPDGDRWGMTAGRLYVTCLSIYTLEVYYRHLPIYQKKAASN
jgi:hypothetical protein